MFDFFFLSLNECVKFLFYAGAMIAHKFRITNPQDYDLYILINGQGEFSFIYLIFNLFIYFVFQAFVSKYNNVVFGQDFIWDGGPLFEEQSQIVSFYNHHWMANHLGSQFIKLWMRP